MSWVLIGIAEGYSLELPQRGDSNEYPQHMFLWRNKQNYPIIITKYPSYLIICSTDLDSYIKPCYSRRDNKFWIQQRNMSLHTTQSTKWPVHPAKTQISLGVHPVWSEYFLSALRKFESYATHKAHSEDTDQTGWMHPRSLARTFAARSEKQWVKRNFQTESQIPGPSECLGMRS